MAVEASRDTGAHSRELPAHTAWLTLWVWWLVVLCFLGTCFCVSESVLQVATRQRRAVTAISWHWGVSVWPSPGLVCPSCAIRGPQPVHQGPCWAKCGHGWSISLRALVSWSLSLSLSSLPPAHGQQPPWVYQWLFAFPAWGVVSCWGLWKVSMCSQPTPFP